MLPDESKEKIISHVVNDIKVYDMRSYYKDDASLYLMVKSNFDDYMELFYKNQKFPSNITKNELMFFERVIIHQISNFKRPYLCKIGGASHYLMLPIMYGYLGCPTCGNSYRKNITWEARHT